MAEQIETKIQLTDRWRREGREDEVRAYRDRVRKELKLKGGSRQEVTDAVWEAARVAFPPLAPSANANAAESQASSADVDAAVADENWVIRSFSPLSAVAEWQARHHVNLTDEALKELLGRLLGFGYAWAWLTGASGDHPPCADCSTDDSLAHVAALIECTFEKMAEAITPADLATFALPNSCDGHTIPA